MSNAPAPRSSLLPRLLTAAVGMPILVAICLWGARPFTVFTMLLALIGRSELQRAYGQCGIHPNRFRGEPCGDGQCIAYPGDSHG